MPLVAEVDLHAEPERQRDAATPASSISARIASFCRSAIDSTGAVSVTSAPTSDQAVVAVEPA